MKTNPQSGQGTDVKMALRPTALVTVTEHRATEGPDGCVADKWNMGLARAVVNEERAFIGRRSR